MEFVSLVGVTATPTATSTMTPGVSSLLLGFVDVKGCARLDAFMSVSSEEASSASVTVRLTFVVSLDGSNPFGTVNPFGFSGETFEVSGGADSTAGHGTIALQFGPSLARNAPYVGVYANRIDFENVDAVVSAWLYCTDRP
jgi:hypothetical protein